MKLVRYLPIRNRCSSSTVFPVISHDKAHWTHGPSAPWSTVTVTVTTSSGRHSGNSTTGMNLSRLVRQPAGTCEQNCYWQVRRLKIYNVSAHSAFPVLLELAGSAWTINLSQILNPKCPNWWSRSSAKHQTIKVHRISKTVNTPLSSCLCVCK